MKQSRKARMEHWLTGVWYREQPTGLFGGLLLKGLESIYRRVISRKNSAENIRLAKRDLSPPVLVVGNVVAGGAGKTPIVQAVCRQLTERGFSVGILTRGYGRKDSAPVLLTPGMDALASECGDEPVWLLKNTHCPIAISADRNQGMLNLLKAHPSLDLIVSDDGLQHLNLPRTLEWIVFDERASGNGKLLPLGPLREPITRLQTADAVLTGSIPAEALAHKLGFPAGPDWISVPLHSRGFRNLKTGEILPLSDALSQWHSKPVTAFTGLGNPDKFFNLLIKQGFKLDRCIPLPDHFAYPPNYCAGLEADLAITTGKDAVKLTGKLDHVWEALIEVTLPGQLIEQIEAKIGRTPD